MIRSMSREEALPPVTLSEYAGVRSLHLGSPWIQGSMRIREPQRIELEYVQRMLASLLWLPTEALGQGHENVLLFQFLNYKLQYFQLDQ